MTESPHRRTANEQHACAISRQPLPSKDLISLDSLHTGLVERIRADHPDLATDARISRKELGRYRQLYIEESLKAEHGEVTALEQQVAQSVAKAETLSENIEDKYAEKRTFGEIAADLVASFGGSWSFIGAFALVMAIWMGINLVSGSKGAFDPYPFILLNLVLSTLAAVQAPIIMMSQKRQEAKDRLRSLNDYRVNLKAEIEIRALHEKLDYILTRHWQRMAELQQLQMEIIAEAKVRK